MSAYTFLGVYRGTRGLQFANLGEEGNGMLATWGIFVVEWALFLLLGLYFEQVCGGSGERGAVLVCTGVHRCGCAVRNCVLPRQSLCDWS
jgi:hypothetical protein